MIDSDRVSQHCIVLLAAALGSGAAAAADIQLKLPVQCDLGRTCFIQNYVDADPSPAAQDFTCGTRTYDGHNGIDFRLPSMRAQRAGVNVMAAADGRVLRVRDAMPDISVRKTDPQALHGSECGNGVVIAHSGDWQTQYCHMARGSLQVQPGQLVKAGQPLGLIGLSGSTEFPHLHFTVRHDGKIADPFAFAAPDGACGGGESLWDAGLREQLDYQQRAVLNAGFTTGAVTMEKIEEGEAGEISPGADAPALVAFVRAIGLKAGDVPSLVVRTPGGQTIARNAARPLDRNQAQSMLFSGAKRPAAGWERGTYTATYSVERNGDIVLQKNLALDLQ